MTLNTLFFLSRLANTCSHIRIMAIKTTEIRDKVQILKGTVQKQMILRYVLFQTKKMLFASIVANGRSRFVQPPVSLLSLSDVFLRSLEIKTL